MVNEHIRMMDGNEAVASVAHRMNEVCVIYPITPSSPMGEWTDAWSSKGNKNIWGMIPQVQEMQSEAGAAGACHGSVQAGALTTTFTASQGLLLMIPNMYKIAGELSPFVMHVAARSIATHALSIFGDQSDVMACRQTGFSMLASNSVQEAHDMASIAQTSSIRTRIPFMHFFDGFRTSHEIKKIKVLTDDELRELVKDINITHTVEQALTPENPVIRGTAQNPDVFFQSREATNKFYDACPEIVQQEMDKFAKITGRKYEIVDYSGAKDAENVVVIMGSGAETTEEAVEYMNANGQKTGVVKVRLYRPFPKEAFINKLPKSVKTISVLDRTKESGSSEPLYLDVISTLSEALASGKISSMPKVIGGRYGLSSKEFTPSMVKAVFENAIADKSINGFTVGIKDDVTYKSLDYDASLDFEGTNVSRAVFYGLGSDGTVGANKNSIKIIAEDAGKFGQGYFVYDSKKAGAMTVSHLRFSDDPIRSAYLISHADFVACHHFPFFQKLDLLRVAKKGSTLLLNAPYPKEEVWDHIPRETQEQIIEKEMKVYSINALEVSRKTGMGKRINTVMQACFFAISNILPKDEAINKIKEAIQKTYGNKSQEIVEKNFMAVDAAIEYLHQIEVPAEATNTHNRIPSVPDNAPDFVKKLTAEIISGNGDELPVSAFEEVVDGTWPTGTTQFEKRTIATEIPIWDEDTCIQCGKCAFVCPHAAIRAKVVENDLLKDAPDTFNSVDYKGKEFKGQKFIIQVSPEDCTGCTLCTDACPAKNKEDPSKKAINMSHIEDHFDEEKQNWDFFETLPYIKRTDITKKITKQVQLLQPLFEFSGACAGCGETPYIKLLTQLFGDRMVIANATGCSSIYGGNLPTTPYTKDSENRGPAWSNSLFEDNAEFGLGMRFSVDQQSKFARFMVQELASEIGEELASDLVSNKQEDEFQIQTQRENVAKLKTVLAKSKDSKAKHLLKLTDYLIKRSLWIIGGDGWAYDIGFSGIDHAIASGKNINILVMDTGVYSNTGGQQSKATPLGAAAKFATAGRDVPRKDLGMIAMQYGDVYVAQVAFGANDAQTTKAFIEAEEFDGPSIIIAYSHCIAHGYDMADGLKQQKLAVETGMWPLYRHNPDWMINGKAALSLDCKIPSREIGEFVDNEARFQVINRSNPERYKMLMNKAQSDIYNKRAVLEHMASYKPEPKKED